MEVQQPILPGGPDKVFELLERANGPEGDGAAAHSELIQEAIQHYKSLSTRDREIFHSRASMSQMRAVGAPVEMDIAGGRKKRRKTKKSKRRSSARQSASRRSLRRLGSR